MALSSMTGFASASCDVGGAAFSWELKSVNARGLEMRVRLPPGLDHLEADIRTMARNGLARGSCFFALAQASEADESRFTLNEEALALVLAAARRLAAAEGIAMPSADGLLGLPGVLQESGERLGGEAAERRDKAVLAAFGAALASLKSARLEEGARLRSTLIDQLAAIARLVDDAASLAAEAPEALRARVAEQVSLLISDRLSLDPDRLHQEAVLAATRADVREEIDRLRSHITAAGELIETGETVGRRLEFLAQEFNREANTLCSKSFDRRLTAVGLELKAVVDQMREQVQNLE